jgi:predicted Ser/Thr protein kinase
MGEVYLGRDPKLGREVALKVITAGSVFGDEAQARFEREARAAALLNHPHIVTVYEFGEDEGLHYLAMEYVHGEELEMLIRGGKVPKAELLEILAQICDGLAYAHEHGVIHRDIKPANVLVNRHGKRPRAKLMDFGVAQMGPSGLTQAGTWMGTVSYMAPEYLDTGKATISSDLFALGVILYEILTGGRKPFMGETTTLVLNRILLHPPEPISPAELKEVPGQLLKVAEQALAKRPEDRFPDAEALGQAIREAMKAPLQVAPATAEPSQASPVREITGQRIRVGKGGNGHCLSLKVALRQAGPGTEIDLLPGTYRESVSVDKDVTIVALGEPGEVVLEGLAGPALVIRTAAARIRGLTLKGPSGSPALRVISGGPALEGCTMKADTSCAEVLGLGTSPVFRNCTFLAEGPEALRMEAGTFARVEGGGLLGFNVTGVDVGAGASVSLLGVELGPAAGVGLKVRNRGQATLDGCTITTDAGSLEVEGDARVQVSHCRLLGSQYAGLLALEHSQAVLESCDIGAHACAGVHVLAGANVVLRQCRLTGNAGFGASIMDRGLATMEGCLVQANGGTGLLIHHGATVQARNCVFSEGRSLGVDCSDGGQGVLDGCEISGNAGAGVQVEAGGSLLLVRCTLKEGRDIGLLLLEDSQVTLEECVVHRNARGGILLAKEAADPVMRGGNRIEDGFLRVDGSGDLVRVAPVQKN